MSFFKKLAITITLEQRDQEIELYPIPIGRFEEVLEVQNKFENAKNANDIESIKLAIDEISKVIKDYSNIPTLEDVKELAMFEIGYIFGQLTEFSQNPKANAVTGQTPVI